MAKAGSLDQRITFQAATLASDGGGGSTKTWANVPSTPTVWASVKPMTGRESLDADRMNATASYLFTVRYRTDISETDRVVWRGENFNIRSVRRTSGRELYTEIEAERGAP